LGVCFTAPLVVNHITLSGRMMDELERFWKETVTQPNAAAILELILGTEENHEIPQDSQYPI
jgi:hypothetical protein